MDDIGIVILIVLVVALIGAAMYMAHRAAKKRREALAALAGELGWQFDSSRDTRHDNEYAHFEVFRRGHSRAAYNTLQGSTEIDDRSFRAKMGDFTYKVTHHTGKGTQTRTYRFSYLILHLPFAGVPDLLIRREGVFDKLAGVLGFDDIDFESAEFSRKFYVKGSDKRFAYDVVHPRMMEFLLASQPPVIDIEQGRCCITDGRTKWQPQEFRSMLEWAREFFDRWPDHLTSQLQGE